MRAVIIGGEKAGRCVGYEKSTMGGKYTYPVMPLNPEGRSADTSAISLITCYCTRYHSVSLGCARACSARVQHYAGRDWA
jgi:hypothetical protein